MPRRLAPVVGALSLAALGPNVHAECVAWTQSRCDETNVAAIELPIHDSRDFKAWTFEGSGRVWGYEPGLTTWTSPAVGTVKGKAVLYVGSYDHALYALDAFSGDELWRFNTGAAIHSAPVLSPSSEAMRVFVSSNDRIVYALDAETGRPQWNYTIVEYRPSLDGARIAAPCVGETANSPFALFVPYWVWDRSVANLTQRSGVVALNATGAKLWEKEVGEGELTAATYTRIESKRYLFLGSNTGNIFALDADNGDVVWSRTELDAVRNPPAVGKVENTHVVFTTSKYGIVRGVDALTGKEVWQRSVSERVTGSPAFVDQTLFVPSYDRSLHVLGAQDGKPLSRFEVGGGVFTSPAVVREKSQVLFAAWDNMLHVRDYSKKATAHDTYLGSPLWNVGGMDDSNWSSPIAVKMGKRWMAFVGSYDGKFRGISLEGDDRQVVDRRSNIRFWLSFPMFLVPVTILARLLTRSARRAQKRES